MKKDATTKIRMITNNIKRARISSNRKAKLVMVRTKTTAMVVVSKTKEERAAKRVERTKITSSRKTTTR